MLYYANFSLLRKCNTLKALLKPGCINPPPSLISLPFETELIS